MGSLFASRNGTSWDQNLLVKRKLHPLLEKLGIARVGLHAFRHFSASIMDRLNVSLKLRQQRLGHSDPVSTLGCTGTLRKKTTCVLQPGWEQISVPIWTQVVEQQPFAT
jgi:integrase